MSLPAQAAILVAVCLVVVTLLAITHAVTEPFITAAREKALIETRQSVFTEAESFEPVADLPQLENLREVHLAYAGGQCIGMVATSVGFGFNGEVVLVSGIDLNGNLTGCSVTEHGETPGLGTKVASADYLVNYAGLPAAEAQAVDAVSGCTVTTNAVKSALSISFAAFDALRGEGIL